MELMLGMSFLRGRHLGGWCTMRAYLSPLPINTAAISGLLVNSGLSTGTTYV